MVVHYVPGIPVQRDIIKQNKLVPFTAVRNGFSESKVVRQFSTRIIESVVQRHALYN